MSKYLTILFLLLVAAPCLAQYDGQLSIAPREYSKMTVLSRGVDVVHTSLILEVLNWANSWVNRSNEGSLSGGEKARLSQMINFWVATLSNTQGAESYHLATNQPAYMSNKYGTYDSPNYSAGQGAIHDNLSTAEQYAAIDDLTVSSREEVGYYYGRNNTSWQGKHYQISFVADQTEYVFYARATQTPIVLDLDGDGKLEASNGQWLPHEMVIDKEKLVDFDMNGDGFADKTEWVGANDGILVQYTDGDMTVANFFGSEGEKFRNGFEKLSLLDKDGDKKISGEELKTLSVWQDKNGNAKVDEGEVTSVEALGITEIKVDHVNLVSHFTQNGKSMIMWDWNPTYFNVKTK